MPEVTTEDNVKVIKVYEPDLVQFQETLNTVYHFCISYDLFNQYKNLSNTLEASPLTRQVKRMQNRLDSYMEELNETEEDVS